MLACTCWRVKRDAACPQMQIWDAGSVEDYMITASKTGEPIISTMVPDNSEAIVTAFRASKGGITAYQLWQIQKARRDLRETYLEHWNNTVTSTGTGRPVDAIICPVAPFAATPHGQNRSVVPVSKFYSSANGIRPDTRITPWCGMPSTIRRRFSL